MFDSEIHPNPCLKTCSAKTHACICLDLFSEQQVGGRSTEPGYFSKEEHHSLLLMHLSTDCLSPLGKKEERRTSYPWRWIMVWAFPRTCSCIEGWRTSSALHLEP